MGRGCWFALGLFSGPVLVLSFLKMVIKGDHIMVCRNLIAVVSEDKTEIAVLGDMGSVWYSKNSSAFISHNLCC